MCPMLTSFAVLSPRSHTPNAIQGDKVQTFDMPAHALMAVWYALIWIYLYKNCAGVLVWPLLGEIFVYRSCGILSYRYHLVPGTGSLVYRQHCFYYPISDTCKYIKSYAGRVRPWFWSTQAGIPPDHFFNFFKFKKKGGSSIVSLIGSIGNMLEALWWSSYERPKHCLI
jgi:hypothetical protein